MSEDLSKYAIASQRTEKFHLDALLTYAPLSPLMDAIAHARWFEGVVLATSFYEVEAVEKIKQYFRKNEKNIDPNRIENMSLSTLIVLLYSYGLITEKDYTRMHELNGFRRKVVHKFVDKINPNEAEKNIKTGIDCLENLRNVR